MSSSSKNKGKYMGQVFFHDVSFRMGGGVITVLKISCFLKNSTLNLDTKLDADFFVARSTNGTLHFCQKSKDKTFYFAKYEQNQYLTLCIVIS